MMLLQNLFAKVDYMAVLVDTNTIQRMVNYKSLNSQQKANCEKALFRN